MVGHYANQRQFMLCRYSPQRFPRRRRPEPDKISPLIDALDKISPDNLSPKEALDALYRLKLLVPGCTDGSK